jgi:hypothetical protein
VHYRTRREYAAPIIAAVIKAEGVGSPTLRRALREAYPFGERRYWPYKVWLNEIKRQLTGRHLCWVGQVDPRQLTLFD